jgi:hypothetical protein
MKLRDLPRAIWLLPDILEALIYMWVESTMDAKYDGKRPGVTSGTAAQWKTYKVLKKLDLLPEEE